MHPCMIDPYGMSTRGSGAAGSREKEGTKDEGRQKTKNRTILSIYMGPGARAGHFP